MISVSPSEAGPFRWIKGSAPVRTGFQFSYAPRVFGGSIPPPNGRAEKTGRASIFFVRTCPVRALSDGRAVSGMGAGSNGRRFPHDQENRSAGPVASGHAVRVLGGGGGAPGSSVRMELAESPG